MSNKKLDEQTIVNELKGNSLFFQERNTASSQVVKKDSAKDPRMPLERPQTSPIGVSRVSEQKASVVESVRVGDDEMSDANKMKNEIIYSQQHDIAPQRYPDAKIEIIRKAVKQFGKEVSTHRLTSEEKKLLRQIIYAYESNGIRTTENEITRVAMHYLIDDYRENGNNSVLARVLARLNA